MTSTLQGITATYNYYTDGKGWRKPENNITVVFTPTKINKKMELCGECTVSYRDRSDKVDLRVRIGEDLRFHLHTTLEDTLCTYQIVHGSDSDEYRIMWFLMDAVGSVRLVSPIK